VGFFACFALNVHKIFLHQVYAAKAENTL